ncbi:uncharacterized protein LOC110450872 [Mizuhopecten yessoensis]|uniref:C1q domain-containing protein n=1 Tax=Mizuhopecten yessoensis TaxID=6573 RepID=A0A210QN28_MIZYE|nr:uncharacterized protein LOC110450872 [Mizuhopecten yessoensis]OWF50146.1 hypothetical protein KP79_PYT14104 [Mizuhopecten yessoensis]
MAAMLEKFVLVIYVTGTFGHMITNQPDAGNPSLKSHGFDPDNPPLTQRHLDPDIPLQQWQDLVTFVNENIKGMKQLLTKKDEQIDLLILNIAGQTTEIQQLKQGVTSVEKELSQNDEIVDTLLARISDLERIVISDTTPSERESRQNIRSQLPRTYHKNRLGLGKSFDSKSGSSVKKMSAAQLPIPESTNHQNVSIMPTHSKPRIENDNERVLNQSDEEETVAQNENESTSKISRFQHKGSTTPSARQTIAFHVVLSKDNFVSNDDVVVYDNETLDIGYGYNPRNGVYVVPEAGTYVFTWTSICYGQEELQTVLVVNSAVRGSSWTDSELSKDIHQTTAVVVLTLNQRDHVFIRMGPLYGHGVLLSRTDVAVSTFSGWKLD